MGLTMGSAMKPSSEPLELLTVTQQNGFTAHNNRRASLHLAFDKYSEQLTCIREYLSQGEKYE